MVLAVPVTISLASLRVNKSNTLLKEFAGWWLFYQPINRKQNLGRGEFLDKIFLAEGTVSRDRLLGQRWTVLLALRFAFILERSRTTYHGHLPMPTSQPPPPQPVHCGNSSALLPCHWSASIAPPLSHPWQFVERHLSPVNMLWRTQETTDQSV